MIKSVMSGDRLGKTILVKLDRSPAVNSIKADCFLLENILTNETVVDAFRDIDTGEDYNIISRVVTLRPKTLLGSGEYRVTVAGLKSASGLTYPSASMTLRLDADSDTVIEIDEPPVSSVVDYSILDISPEDLDAPGLIEEGDGGFGVVSVDPPPDQWFLEEDHNNGIVSIRFNKSIDPSYMSSKYFKISRKKIQVAPSRWERVDVDFLSNEDMDVVHMSIRPFEEGKYIEEGYVYKLTVLEGVKSKVTDE